MLLTPVVQPLSSPLQSLASVPMHSHQNSQSRIKTRLVLQKDSWAIDYQATLNTLEVAQEMGASHFVLLSAICVQKPLLEFQHAKLRFEQALQSAEGITYSIVRPTAFFKSLAGQASFAECCLLPVGHVQAFSVYTT